jgi:hypothetical protein
MDWKAPNIIHRYQKLSSHAGDVTNQSGEYHCIAIAVYDRNRQYLRFASRADRILGTWIGIK